MLDEGVKVLKAELLTGLKSRLADYRLEVDQSRLVAISASDVVPAIVFEVTKQADVHIIDPSLFFYWAKFSTVLEHVVAEKPMGSLRVARWKRPCLALSFARLPGATPTWENFVVGDKADLSRCIDELAHAFVNLCEPFIATYASIEGLDRYLRLDPYVPGNWRLTLECLLIDQLKSREEACLFLEMVQPRTRWEELQRDWLRTAYCGSKL